MPRTFTSIMWSQSSMLHWSNGCQFCLETKPPKAAALLTRISILPPYVSATSVTAASHCSRSVTSQVTGVDSPPAALISSATETALGPLMSRTPTLAPSLPRRRAIDRPMLLVPPPPVTSATLPCRHCPSASELIPVSFWSIGCSFARRISVRRQVAAPADPRGAGKRVGALPRGKTGAARESRLLAKRTRVS